MIFDRIARAVIRHGVLGSLALIPRNIRALGRSTALGPNGSNAPDAFDLASGTDTARPIDVGAYRDVAPHETRGAHRYQTIAENAILAALESVGIDVTGLTFVDYGCGKGRVLLVAAQMPFARIIGIELSPNLTEIARRNVRLSRPGEDERIQCLCENATTFLPPDASSLYYFYDPFSTDVFEKVIDAIVRVHRASGHPVYAVYFNPTSRGAFDRSSFWRLRSAHSEWLVYERSDSTASVR